MTLFPNMLTLNTTFMLGKTRKWSRTVRKENRLCACFAVLCLVSSLYSPTGDRNPCLYVPTSLGDQNTLVTYAYAEGLGNGGEIDLHNLRYFMHVALGGRTPGTEDPRQKVFYNIVVSGGKCTPCRDTLPSILRKSRRRKGWVTVLKRENFGMDFGAYNTSIEWLKSRGSLSQYKYFVFINSSLRGPFMPKWTPRDFHFTDALVQMMVENTKIKLVGSYISCLPAIEPFPGPILESLFFAVDEVSLSWLVDDGIFIPREEKKYTALFEEYGLLRSITSRGGYVEGLSMRYSKDLDWTDTKHHTCNDNRHSSRRGMLDGDISPSPLEHVFLKTSWCVRATEASIYSDWLVRLSLGKPGTEGRYDSNGYLRGISVEGTSSKRGTLPVEVPDDGCKYGDISSLRVPE